MDEVQQGPRSDVGFELGPGGTEQVHGVKPACTAGRDEAKDYVS
jgi:hypothetical protein